MRGEVEGDGNALTAGGERLVDGLLDLRVEDLVGLFNAALLVFLRRYAGAGVLLLIIMWQKEELRAGRLLQLLPAAVAGLLPIEVRVPSIGPSLYAAAELTPEGKAPDVRFTFKREVK